MSEAERLYLESLESDPTLDIDLSNTEAVEAEIRRREWEKTAKNFNPKAPLYKSAAEERRSLKDKSEKPGRQSEQDQQSSKKSYQHDPRYRDFYLNKRKQQDAGGSAYDEDIEPISLEELSKQRMKTSPATPAHRTPAVPIAPVSVQPQVPPARAEEPGSDEIETGTIFHFDDDSVGIYKDVVSGKDYALFFFLEPDGAVDPQGIFLEQYEKRRIGLLREPYFEKLRAEKRWDRDVIIYHLDKLENATFIRHLSYRTPQAHRQAAPAEDAENRKRIYQEHRDAARTPAPVRNLLERGRVVRINVGGRVWEAVYWTRDEISAIVAHNTNREWALMHFDVNRFKDSIEYGELLNSEELQAIEESLVRQGK